MTKYGKQRRDEERRDSKRFAAEITSDSRWTPDPTRDTFEVQQTDFPGDRLVSQRVVKDRESGLILEFAVVVKERTAGDDWVELLCIDTCNHGTVHRHVDGDHSDDARQDIAQVTNQEVVQNGFWDAIGEAYDRAYGEGDN